MSEYIEKKQIVFLPGGPWISGVYMDHYLSNWLSEFKVKRISYPNHEFDYGRYRNLTFKKLFRIVIKSIQVKSKEITYVGHSYGGLLLLELIAKKILNPVECKIILVDVPLSIKRSKKYYRDILKLDIKNYINDNQFNSEFMKLLRCYFSSHRKYSIAKKLFNDSFFEMNKGANLEPDDFKRLKSAYYKNIDHLIVINGADDLLLLKSDYKSKRSKVRLIPNCGHFPMIEQPKKFTEILENILDD